MASTATITLLFCDLVGSTEIYTQHGDLAADESRRAFFAALRGVVATSDGTEVKNTGDGLMVAFPSSAAAAVRCAIAMQQAMESLRSPSGEPLQLCVGICTGEVTHDDDDWFGTPVNEAARLCAAASPGTILASDVVRSLVEPRGEHRFGPSKPYLLKGLGREVRAASIDWQGGDGEVPPNPKRPRRARAPKRRRTPLLVAAVIAAIALVAGGLWVRLRGSDHSATAAASAIAMPVGYTPQLADEPCPPEYTAADGTLACSAMVVPEDRTQPDGRQVHVQVVRMPPRNGQTSALAPIVVVAQDHRASDYIADPLRSDHELVVMVRRGFGGDPSLTCPEVGDAMRTALAIPMSSPDYTAATVAASAQCLQQWTARGVDLDSYADQEAAADFRDLVLAMGGQPVDLRVDSEATGLGLRIVGESGPQVGAVLIGDPIEPGGNRFAGRIPDAVHALDQVDTMCHEDPTCSARFGDTAAARNAWVAERNADPKLLAITSPINGATTMVHVDGDTLLETAVDALGAGNVSVIPQVIAARSDDVVASFHAGQMLTYAQPVTPWIAFGAVWCLDQQNARLDPVLATEEAGHPELAALNADARIVAARCKQNWPSPHLPLPTAARSIPTLILTGGLDPTSSPRRAELTAKAFGDNSTVVVFPTLGGYVANAPSADPCIAELEADFLANANHEVDAQSCVDKIPPPQWSAD